MNPIWAPVLYVAGAWTNPTVAMLQARAEARRVRKLPEWYFDEEAGELRKREKNG